MYANCVADKKRFSYRYNLMNLLFHIHTQLNEKLLEDMRSRNNNFSKFKSLKEGLLLHMFEKAVLCMLPN